MTTSKRFRLKHREPGKGHTRKELTAAARNIVNSALLNAPLGADESHYLSSILRRHYQWHKKCGAGIHHLEVRLNAGPYPRSLPTRGIWIVRTDGSSIDISCVVALGRKDGPTQQTNLVVAARREVTEQIRWARAKQAYQPCSLCGLALPLGEDAHVDHAPPNTFAVLLEHWLSMRRLQPQDIELVDHGMHMAMKDRKLAGDWFAWHEARADLRLIHKHENLALPRVRRLS